MSRARYHNSEGAPQLSGHQERPVGAGDRSKRVPKAETQVLGAAFPDKGRGAAARLHREAEEMKKSGDAIGALREKLGASEEEVKVREMPKRVRASERVSSVNLPMPKDTPGPSQEFELQLKQQELKDLEEYTKHLFGHSIEDLDKNPNIINKDKGVGARLKGWFYAKVGRSSDGLLDVHLSQWRTLKQEIKRKESEMEPPISSKTPSERQRLVARARMVRDRGGLTSSEWNDVLDQKAEERRAAEAYRRENHDSAPADKTLERGRIAVARGNNERANRLASALTEQAFFDDGMTLEGAVPKIKRESAQASAAAKARAERVRRDGASQEDYDALSPDQFNALLAENMASEQELKAGESLLKAGVVSEEDLENLSPEEINALFAKNMASQKELEEGALSGPYADSSLRGRGNQYSGGSNVEGAFARRGANQLLGRPVVEAPRGTVEQAFKSLLTGSQTLIDQARAFQAKGESATSAQMERFRARMKSLADERSRLADTPGFDQTPEYAQAMKLYRDLIAIDTELADGTDAPELSYGPDVDVDVPGDEDSEPVKTNKAKRVPDAAALEKLKAVEARRQEGLAKADREALANLESTLGTDEAKRLYEEVSRLIVVDEYDMAKLSPAEAAFERQDRQERLRALSHLFRVDNAPVAHVAVIQKYMALVAKNRQFDTEALRTTLKKANDILGFTAQHNIIAPEVIPNLPSLAQEDEDVTDQLEEVEDMSADLEEEKSAERFEGAVATRASSKHESWNEDSSIANDAEQLYGVFDGMGGHQGGEFASKFAKKQVEQNATLLNADDVEDVKAAMAALLKGVSEDLQRVGKEQGLKNPGTTASLVKIIEGLDGKRTAVIGTVGDSRTYVRNVNGRTKFVSQEQSMLAVMRKGGMISEEEAQGIAEALSNVATQADVEAASAKYSRFSYLYNNRNAIAQAIGIPGTEPEVETADLEEGDEVIVLSDGVTDNLTDKEIQAILGMKGTSQEITKMLVQKAYERSQEKGHIRSKPDDITAVVASGPSKRKAKPVVAAPRKGTSRAKPPALPANPSKSRTRKAS